MILPVLVEMRDVDEAVSLQCVPFVDGPARCLLVVGKVVAECDVAAHIPQESLLIDDGTGETAGLGCLNLGTKNRIMKAALLAYAPD